MNVVSQLEVIARERARFQQQLESLVDPDWPSTVCDVVTYIHGHLFDPALQMCHVREACNIQHGRFRIVFKRHCRRSMRDYCEDLRMMAALRLLTCEGLEIGSIAFEVGYQNYRTFGRAFKRFFGKTPTELRREISHRLRDRTDAPCWLDESDFDRLVT